MTISHDTIIIIAIIFSWIFGGYLLLTFDGLMLFIKGVRLFEYEYDNLDSYDKLAFNIWQITIIGIIVSILYITIFILKGGF